MIRRIWLIALTALAALPLAPDSAGAITTPCDSRPDTPVPGDAILSTRFLADVDGDGARDVVTGYRLGSDSDLAEYWLHLELASGWGTQVRIDTIPEFAATPQSTPMRVVTMTGERLIVVDVQGIAVGSAYALFSFRDCVLAPVPLAAGGYPEIWWGLGPFHDDWFSCGDEGVVMVVASYGVDENGERIEGVYAEGEGLLYILEYGVFHPGGQNAMNLPRPVVDVREDLPNCASFVGTFVDDDANLFEQAIEWLVYEGITTGCNPPLSDRYCPDGLVTRGQMAAFLVRAMGYTDDGGGDLFLDDDGHVFEGAIDRLGAAGATRGCNPPANDRFCPDRHVTRAEMAAFLTRALGHDDPGAGDWFVDDDGTIYEDAIDRLRFAEVTLGCNPPLNDRYCPSDNVTRGQMAAFLRRALE
jgi:hypothetical protein